jgi:tetratricopeptide (TPR) repeat protein
MYVEVLANHPAIAMSLNNLAVLYKRQGQYKEAEAMYMEALAMRRRALPEDHPHIARSLNNSAALCKVQRRYEKAEPMYMEVLAMRRRALPEDHPDIVSSLNNLAVLYKVQRRYGTRRPSRCTWRRWRCGEGRCRRTTRTLPFLCGIWR